MTVIGTLRPALLAGGCVIALTFTSTLAAQQTTQDPAPEGAKPAPDAQGAKRSPGTPSAKSSPDQKQTGQAKESSQSKDQSAHKALTRANVTALDEAQALKDQASMETAQLNSAMVARRTEAIGKNLETARRKLATLEASAATMDEETRDRLKSMREKQESAAEHQRALVQASKATPLDPDDIEKEAEGIVKDLQDAEAEHRKLPGAATMQAPPNSGSGQTKDKK